MVRHDTYFNNNVILEDEEHPDEQDSDKSHELLHQMGQEEGSRQQTFRPVSILDEIPDGGDFNFDFKNTLGVIQEDPNATFNERSRNPSFAYRDPTYAAL